MTKNFFYTVVFDSHGNGSFSAKAPMFPGNISYGHTIEEAEEKIKKVIISRLKEMEKAGIPYPEETLISFPFVKAVSINISESRNNVEPRNSVDSRQPNEQPNSVVVPPTQPDPVDPPAQPDPQVQNDQPMPEG